jgi:hypothetical protein
MIIFIFVTTLSFLRKLSQSQMEINVIEPKLLYLQQMGAFHEARASNRHERDLHICSKEMQKS